MADIFLAVENLHHLSDVIVRHQIGVGGLLEELLPTGVNELNIRVGLVLG